MTVLDTNNSQFIHRDPANKVMPADEVMMMPMDDDFGEEDADALMETILREEESSDLCLDDDECTQRALLAIVGEKVRQVSDSTKESIETSTAHHTTKEPPLQQRPLTTRSSQRDK